MKRTGEILRKAREAKNLSINEIALSLKINSKALTAIEEGDLSKLPAKTFLRGFVQSYAQALKIDTDEVLNVFAEEMGSTRPQPLVVSGPAAAPSPNLPPADDVSSGPEKAAPALETPKPIRSRNESKSESLKGLEETSHVKLAILSGVSLVLILLIFGTKKVIDRYQREATKSDVVVTTPLSHETPMGAPTPVPETTGTTPPPAAAPEASKPADGKKDDLAKGTETPAKPVEAAKPDVVRKDEPVKPAATNTTKAHTPSFVNRNAPVDQPPSQEETPLLNSLNPTKASPLSPMSSKGLAAAAQKNEQKAKPEAAKPAEPAKPAETAADDTKKPKKSLELIIEAMDSVDIEYSGSKGSPQKIHLDADQVHTIRSKNGIKITVSNAGVVNLILNGRDLGVPGGLGSPVTLTY